MPPQHDARNQAVVDAFQSVILQNRIVSAVKCLYCHRQMTSETTRQQTHLKWASCTSSNDEGVAISDGNCFALRLFN